MLVPARALNGKMLSSTGYSLLLMYCRASVSTISLSLLFIFRWTMELETVHIFTVVINL